MLAPTAVGDRVLVHRANKYGNITMISETMTGENIVSEEPLWLVQTDDGGKYWCEEDQIIRIRPRNLRERYPKPEAA